MARRAILLTVLLAVSGMAHAAQVVTTESLRLTFSDAGSLESAIACFPSCSDENVRLQQFGDAGVVGVQPFTGGAWTYRGTQGPAHQEMRFEHTSGASLTWRVPVRGYRVELEADYPGGLTIASGESFRPRDAAGFGNWLEQSRYVVLEADGVSQVGFDDTEAEPVEDSRWIGYRNRYWTLLAAPPAGSRTELATAEDARDATLNVQAEPGAWSFYLGPVEPVILAQAAPGLDDILYAGLWFWLRWICIALFHLLGWIHLLIPSWGLAIIALSVAVNLLMTPLSRIADRFQQQVNETEARLAPELQRIKKNYKGEEQSAKILALYKTERVHPLYSLKSMLGVAVVIPVFIGAFDMLAENIHLLHTGFLWIADLSRPDSLFTMPFRLPFFGADLNLLPFLMTTLSFIASALHKPLALNAELRRKQVINMILLALVFFVLFYTFPAGMVLYWTTNNLISVSKSLWARR
ncbi:MAG: membrane protein insertase YidC [Xanthomonadales bacterium]